jgi:hypothetical protein
MLPRTLKKHQYGSIDVTDKAKSFISIKFCDQKHISRIFFLKKAVLFYNMA